MKRYLILLCATVMIAAGCNESEYSGITVDSGIESALKSKYPGASKIVWEQRGLYKVASFRIGDRNLTSWFHYEGQWLMTEEEIAYMKLPASVTSSFGNSSYASGSVQGAVEFTRSVIEDIYVITVDQGNELIDLFYSAQGIFIKTESHKERTYEDYRNEIAPDVPQKVYSVINNNVSSPKIMEVNIIFPGTIYVDVIDGKQLKQFTFDMTGYWYSTAWEVSSDYMNQYHPELMYQLAGEISLRDYNIEKFECCQTASSLYYLCYLTSPEGTKTIKLG